MTPRRTLHAHPILRRASLALAALALPAAALRAQDGKEAVGPPVQAPSPAESAHPFDLRVSPFVELFQEVRARAEQQMVDGTAEPSQNVVDVGERGLLDDAVEAARKLSDALGTSPSGRFLEAHLLGCEDAAELRQRFQLLPDEAPRAGGEPADLRKQALALADELAKVQDRWKEEVWPLVEGSLEAKAKELDLVLNGDVGKAMLADADRELGLRPPPAPVPIHLVTTSPRPIGITLRTPEGPTSFVAVGNVSGAMAIEVVLHEALHAFDATSAERSTLPSELRAGLAAAGIPPTAPAFRDAVHTLFFVEAAALVRRHVDPKYEGYGVESGVYARLDGWPELWKGILPELGKGAESDARIVDRVVLQAKAVEAPPLPNLDGEGGK